MKGMRFGLALFPLFLGLQLHAQPRPPGPDPAARSANAFAADLCRKLDTAGNQFLSPYSIHTALGMVYAGTRGATEKEMAATLHFPAGREAPHGRSARLRKRIDSLGAMGQVRIHAANAMWTQEGMPMLGPFLDIQKRHYGAEPRRVDFAGDPETQRLLINQWAETETRGRIKDLVPPRGIDSRTRLAICNAIHFKGKWARAFDSARTRAMPFRLAPQRTIQVPMMRQKGRFRIAVSGRFTVLELPYEGGDFSLVVGLPDTAGSLAAAETGWFRGGMEDAVSRLAASPLQDMDVALPRFKLTCDFELSEALKGMGMASAFGGDADFTGMAKGGGIAISRVIHKAFVEVNEEGTEAAAATAVLITRGSAHRRTDLFLADRPFLFLIRENHTGLLLFLGRVADPRG